jgi:hypothetical protein
VDWKPNSSSPLEQKKASERKPLTAVMDLSMFLKLSAPL